MYQSPFIRATPYVLADLARIIALRITFLAVCIHFRCIYYLSTADLEALIGFWRHNINKPLLKVADTNNRGLCVNSVGVAMIICVVKNVFMEQLMNPRPTSNPRSFPSSGDTFGCRKRSGFNPFSRNTSSELLKLESPLWVRSSDTQDINYLSVSSPCST